jgi:hypothetical protein
MTEIPVSVRLSFARALGALAVLGIGLVWLARPVEHPRLEVVAPEVLQPVSIAAFPVSDASTYTAPSSYHTGPTQGPGD